jgi:hypothetical protein
VAFQEEFARAEYARVVVHDEEGGFVHVHSLFAGAKTTQMAKRMQINGFFLKGCPISDVENPNKRLYCPQKRINFVYKQSQATPNGK